jgi:MFS transporter, Spinster family, sphingosine-1-phosphate transporter
MSKLRYAWVVVGLLWFAFLLNYIDRQVIFSVFPLLKSDFKLSDFELGLLSTSFLWVYAFASPVAGYMGDRFGRKNTVVASLLIWSLMTWATARAKNFQELLAARGLMGVSEAAYLPAGLAMIADYHGKRTRSLATGIHFSGAYLGMVLGGFLGGWIGEAYGWRPAFALLGFVGVAYTLVGAAALREESRNEAPESDFSKAAKPRLMASLKELGSIPSFRTLASVFGMTSVANWLIYTWMPVYLYEHFHMSLLSAGFSAMFYLQAGSAGGILLGGAVADRWSARTDRGRLLTQAAGVAVAASFLSIAAIAASRWLLLGALAAFGLGRGSYDCNCMPVLCQIARPTLRATGYGLFNFVGSFAGGVMAALAGALKASVGLGGILEAAGLLLFGAAVMLFRLDITRASLLLMEK